MNKKITNYKYLRKNFEKIIKNILYYSNVNFSSKSVRFLTEICLKILEEISSKIGSLYEKNLKKTVSEDEVLLVFSELGFDKYIIEIGEEKDRIESENKKLENIIF